MLVFASSYLLLFQRWMPLHFPHHLITHGIPNTSYSTSPQSHLTTYVHRYWPERATPGDKLKLGLYTVKHVETIRLPTFTIRKFKVKNTKVGVGCLFASMDDALCFMYEFISAAVLRLFLMFV